MYAEGTKVCGSCGQAKPRSDFHLMSASRDGLQFRCKACKKHYDSERSNTPERRDAVRRATVIWRERNPAASLFSAWRTRAKVKGREFSLTPEWVEQRLLAGACEVTGIPFVLGVFRHAFLPSIDRIDSSKGYTPENCRVVLWMINAAKNDLAEDDFLSALRQVAEAVVERR